MRRREFITLLGGAAAATSLFWPLAARAQPGLVRRIGVLMASVETDPEELSWVAEFVQELRALGWKDGQNVRIDYRWTGGDAGRAATYAAELVGLAPDAILAQGASVLKPLLQQTRFVPIVFVRVSDPVGGGFVENLPRPGGNVTGFTQFEYTVAGKWLEALKQIAPRLTSVAIIMGPENPLNSRYVHQIKAAAHFRQPRTLVSLVIIPCGQRHRRILHQSALRRLCNIEHIGAGASAVTAGLAGE